MLTNLLLNGGAADEKLYVEDVFSTYLYSGNGSTQTITNGIDLAGKGGLVWTKARTGSYLGNSLYDTASGTNKRMFSNQTVPVDTTANTLTAFNSNGFTLGMNDNANATNGGTAVSWTFRKAQKFFDVVTFSITGGAAWKTIDHSLGVTPGMIIIKSTSYADEWYVYHRSTSSGYLRFNGTDALNTTFALCDTVTSASFRFSPAFQSNSQSYVAYLFAHDTSADGIVQCGSFTTDGSGNATVNLGWEPQYVLVKASSTTDDWRVYDVMRGMTVGDNDPLLRPNLSNAEVTQSFGLVNPVSTGFNWSFGAVPNTTYIYLAIRRGPMRVPTDATKVFTPALQSANTTAQSKSYGIVTDLMIAMARNQTSYANSVWTRQIGPSYFLTTQSDNSDTNLTDAITGFDLQDGLKIGVDSSSYVQRTANWIHWAFRRAPSFFDVSCYSGTGSARTVSHNLAATPELMIVKRRNTNGNWQVYYGQASEYMALNSSAAKTTSNTDRWNNTAPTSTVFSLGTDASVNASGGTYVAYLFATCAGVSKVGTYTGTGTTNQIDCGFTNGARFVLIKRTDSTGDWWVYDTARGIVSGNDPSLLLDLKNAEVTNTDYIDPYSAGFELSSTAPAGMNANGGTFVFLAIA